MILRLQLGRRQLLQAVGLALLLPARLWAAPAPWTAADFAELTQRLLGHDPPPSDIAAMATIVQAEPWNEPHVTGLLAALRKHGDLARARPTLDAGLSWFAEHLLLTWYGGIYYHEARPTVRILRAGAMQYSAAALPVPFLEPVGEGRWAEPP